MSFRQFLSGKLRRCLVNEYHGDPDVGILVAVHRRRILPEPGLFDPFIRQELLRCLAVHIPVHGMKGWVILVHCLIPDRDKAENDCGRSGQ